MVEFESHCVGCTSMGMRCVGDRCPNRDVPHYYCDECGDELTYDEIYDVDEEELCEFCLKKRFRREAF